MRARQEVVGIMLLVDVRNAGASVRFGWSRLAEVTASIRVASRPGQPTWIRNWWRDVHPALAGIDMGLLREAIPQHGFIPGYLFPASSLRAADLHDDLDRLVRLPGGYVQEELTDCANGSPAAGVPGRPMPITTAVLDRCGVTGYLELLASQIETYWESAIAPYWPTFRRALDREMRHQGQVLAESGAAVALHHISDQITWRHDLLVIGKPCRTSHHVAVDAEIRCTASMFIYDDVVTGGLTDGSYHIGYPVRAVGSAWEDRSKQASGALKALLGAVRAALLADLQEPMTTGDLARAQKLSASTVSYHLGVLYRAGLLERDRDGKQVVYRRSLSGDALVG